MGPLVPQAMSRLHLAWTLSALLALASADSIMGKEGYIRNADNKYLTCGSESCTWGPTPSQIFRADPGKEGSKSTGKIGFRILDVTDSGPPRDTSQCLDRQHCHSSKSNLRMSDCGHCGAGKWTYQESDNSLREGDSFQNCVQDDGSSRHCKDSHDIIDWPVNTECKVKDTIISDLKCTNQKTGGTCGADFAGGSLQGASVQETCDACDADKGTSLGCQFSFTATDTSTISTTFTDATAIKVGTTFSVGINFVAEAKDSVTVEVTETLTVGKTKSKQMSTSIGSSCSTSTPAGHKAVATANFMKGTLVGTFTAKVTTTYDCPQKQPTVNSTSGTISITNVPTVNLVGECKLTGVACGKSDKRVFPLDEDSWLASSDPTIKLA